ncbi:disease resistance protein RGA2-like [Primulina huaijiensis]|uniref:disease resistance protein RGA2-like n=1 Tax=Primulina huaijiensis TaxID=1492673 RepID=UPI003CC79607
MSEPIITVILTRVEAILEEMIREEIRLVSHVQKDVDNLTRTFKSLKALLLDAEKQQVKDEAVKVWLDNLKDVSYDADDVLFEWLTAINKSKNDLEAEESSSSIYQKVHFFFTLPCSGVRKVALRRDIALKIKEINQRLGLIAVDKDRYKLNPLEGSDGLDRLKAASYVVESDIRGRDVNKDTLVRKMLSDKNKKKTLNVTSIVGLGGMGKTALAGLVYKSSDVYEHFDMRIWVCVSEPFDEMRVAKAIVEHIEGEALYVFELETVLHQLRNHIAGQRYLLVLDDVWTGECRKWEQIFNSLRAGAAGSVILVTTRHEMVAKTMGSSYELLLGELSEEDSWLLFSENAFSGRRKEQCEELEDVGRELARKCKGLPLVLKTIGGLMRFKTSLQDWQEILSSEFWTLEGAEKELLPPFMLSYYDLPSPLKQCFSFCAYFPKDQKIDADNLIKLWMAQGYIKSTEFEEIEATGQKYLQNLAMRSFFQELEKDKDGTTILRFKIHDMVHDFAQYLTKNECSLIEVNGDLVRKMESSPRSVRHLTLIRSEDAHFPTSIPNVEKLHSFWVQCFYDCPPILSKVDTVEPDLFCRLSRVKALDLSRNRLEELPKEVGKLMSLKYLNLSNNPLWELPEILGELYNLQTLNLSSCDRLKKLPQRIRKLVNLRHLIIDKTNSLKALPKGIGNLNSLQTLSKFIIISRENNGEEVACRIADLNRLNKLRGHLKVEGLGYADDAEEARKAEMHEKTHLSGLHLDFSPITQPCSRKDEVIEALRVHTNLQVLQISSYGGTKFPTWIMNLSNMRELSLQDCLNCTNLPPLGRLPSLVILYIEGMQNLKFIGPEFLGLPVDGNSTFNGGARLQGTSFPKLKKLKISNMKSWEEWDILNGGSFDENVKVMPCLKFLKLDHCGNLKTLPQHLLPDVTLLLKLRIKNCTLLKEQIEKNGEKWSSKLSRIAKVSIS